MKKINIVCEIAEETNKDIHLNQIPISGISNHHNKNSFFHNPTKNNVFSKNILTNHYPYINQVGVSSVEIRKESIETTNLNQKGGTADNSSTILFPKDTDNKNPFNLKLVGPEEKKVKSEANLEQIH